MLNSERFICEVEGRNFQSWREFKFNLVSGVNSFSGSSDSGKSAFIRLLEWIIENEAGNFEEEVRNWDCKKDEDTYGSIRFNDGIHVERIRNLSGKNEYRLNGEVFKALRGKVPAEVREAIGLNKINVQPQWQNYFLLDKPSGQVAKELNLVADLSGADVAITNINKRVKETTGEGKTIAADILTKKTEINALDFVSECNEKLVAIEADSENLEVIDSEIEQLQTDSQVVVKASEELDEAGAQKRPI